MTRRALVVEILIVAAFLVLGGSVGSFASRQFNGQRLFYPGEFGPAVMVAAGRGFVNPVVEPGSPLGDFLDLKRQQISTSELAGVKLKDRDQFQEATRYLLLAMGYTWRFAGISWGAASGLLAVLYALSVAACYGLCRVWLSRTLAALGALFFCFSPLQLQQLPQLRDYSKAPFILLAILLLVLVCTRPLSRRLVIALSAACGVVIGVGLGFKMDVVVMAPIFLASLVLFRDRRPWTGLADKAMAAGVFVLTLVLTAAPVLTRLSSGGTNGYHVILLGYADSFDDFLGVNRPVYSFLPFYSDVYLNAVLETYGEQVTGKYPSVPSPEYDAVSRAYWWKIIRHFPADVSTRALAAARVVLNLPVNEPALNFLAPPTSRGNPLWTVLTNLPPHRARIGAAYEWASALNGWGLFLGIVLVAAASMHSTKTGVFAGSMLLILPAYASLQFAPRHFFHLEIIPVFALMVAIGLVVDAVFRRPGWPAVRRFAVSGVVFVMAVVTLLIGVRGYQKIHLRRVFQQYVDSARESVQPQLTDVGDGIWRASWTAPSHQPTLHGAPLSDYYVIEFDGAPAHEMSVLGIRYRSTTSGNDYSRVVALSESSGVNRVFVPAYGEPPEWTLDGFELPAGIRNRLRGIYRLSNPEQLPLLLELRLRGDWQNGDLHQTLRLETDGVPDTVQLLSGATGTSISRLALIRRADSAAAKPAAAEVDMAYTKAVRVTDNGVEMDGRADTQSAYLLQFKPVQLKAPASLLVKGRVFTGGVMFGLLKDNQWYRQVGTNSPGEFIAVVEITDSGTYTPIVTNNTARDHDRNRFVLSRFGVVAANSQRPQ
jgi:hypothetical protein